MRPRGVGGVGWPAPSTTCRTCWRRPTRIIGQTRQRIAGTTPDGATRVVSLHDRQARPIAKGRLGKPVEFGYKGQVVDNDDGVVLDHDVQAGNPPMHRNWPRRSSGSRPGPVVHPGP